LWGEGNFCEQKFPSPHTPHPSKNFFFPQNRVGHTQTEETDWPLLSSRSASLRGFFKTALL